MQAMTPSAMTPGRLAALPVFVVALLIQLIAPIGAQRAMARDPLGVHALCLAAPADNAPVAPASQDSHDQCCALCGLAMFGAPPAAGFAPPLRAPFSAQPALARLALHLSPAGLPAPARGPPPVS